jgi:hypothetical protein
MDITRNRKTRLGVAIALSLALVLTSFFVAPDGYAGRIDPLWIIKNITVKGGAGQFSASWDKVSGADYYKMSYELAGVWKRIILPTKYKKTSCTVTIAPGNYYPAALAYKDDGTLLGYSEAPAVKVTAAPKASATAPKTAIPKKVTGLKLKAGKKQITVSWTKKTGVSGYRIKLATDKKFTKNVKYVKVKGVKSVKKTIGKLKTGKYYYVKVRAYKTSGGKTVYGPYNSYKRIKVK